MEIAQIISDLGGDAEVARACGVEPNSVAYWRKRRSIPAKHWPALLDHARLRGATLVSDDLLRAHHPDVAA